MSTTLLLVKERVSNKAVTAQNTKCSSVTLKDLTQQYFNLYSRTHLTVLMIMFNSMVYLVKDNT